MTATARRILGAWAVATAAVLGCGKDEPAAATVKGAVTFQGRPLAGGLVLFAPDRDKGNAGKPVTATVGPDGWYHLTADGSSQVVAGWYRVAIAEAPGWVADSHGARFPAALRRPDRAGLDREVLAGRENVFHFEIEVPE